MKVLLAGGGTAGHISPLLAIAEALIASDPANEILAVGTEEGLEARLVPEAGHRLVFIPKVPFPRSLNAKAVTFPFKMAAAVAKAVGHIRSFKADVVVGMGGYVSTPCYFAAKITRTPIVIHEQNSTAGLANRLGAKLTSHIAVTFEATSLPNAQLVGMPLRKQITQLNRQQVRAEAAEFFSLEPDKPTLLITGGSLGAQRINEAMNAAIDEIIDSGAQVIHLTGRNKSDGVTTAENPSAHRIVEYLDRMELAYAMADLVLCRSGANTVCELSCVGLPAAFVPLAIGNGEQSRNAKPMVDAGAALMVENDALDASWITKNVLPLLHDKERLAKMSEQSAALGSRNAAEEMAEIIVQAAGKST